MKNIYTNVLTATGLLVSTSTYAFANNTTSETKAPITIRGDSADVVQQNDLIGIF